MLFYNVYAAGFTVLLVRTLVNFPLIPPELNSLAWNSQWLLTTVVDYYGAALALCGVIIASEKRRDGILWSLGCLLLGTPFCCMYVATRLLRKGSLRLSGSGDLHGKMVEPSVHPLRKAVLFYSAYAAGFTFLLVRTLMKFPLIPPDMGSLAWNSKWLLTTVVDYYGAALALCGVIIASEKRRDGILWSLGCLLLGTPLCCMYVATRLMRKSSLRLLGSDS